MTEHCGICDFELPPRDNPEYVRCCVCGAVRTAFKYNAAQYAASYAKNYLEYAQNPINTPLNLYRLGLVSQFLSPGAIILDIGCCVGEFIRFAEKYYDCIGFEPNLHAVDYARYRVSKSRVISELPDPRLDGNNGKFSCITLFDVIEHIEHPHELLGSIIYHLLQPGGIVALTTPNVLAFKDSTWKHFKPKEHLWLFSEMSLRHLLQTAGFEVVSVSFGESDIRPGNPNKDLITVVARKEK